MPDTASFKEKLLRLSEETAAALTQAAESSKPVALDQTRVGRIWSSRSDLTDLYSLCRQLRHKKSPMLMHRAFLTRDIF